MALVDEVVRGRALQHDAVAALGLRLEHREVGVAPAARDVVGPQLRGTGGQRHPGHAPDLTPVEVVGERPEEPDALLRLVG